VRGVNLEEEKRSAVFSPEGGTKRALKLHSESEGAGGVVD